MGTRFTHFAGQSYPTLFIQLKCEQYKQEALHRLLGFPLSSTQFNSPADYLLTTKLIFMASQQRLSPPQLEAGTCFLCDTNEGTG